MPKILEAFACRCIPVNAVKNTGIVILQANKDNVATIETALAHEAEDKYKNMHT